MTVTTVNLRKLLPSLALPLIVGAIGSVFVVSGLPAYNQLNQPPLTPPGWLFGVAWTVFYVLMGVGAYLVKASDCFDKSSALQLYYIQLALNLLWIIVFFRYGLYTLSAIILAVLISAIFFTIVRFSQCNRLAGKLNLPYLLWCLFALYLNIGVALLN